MGMQWFFPVFFLRINDKKYAYYVIIMWDIKFPWKFVHIFRFSLKKISIHFFGNCSQLYLLIEQNISLILLKNMPVYSARSKPNRKQGIEVFFFSFTQRTIGLVFFVLNLSLDIFVCFSITYMAYFWFHLRLGGLWFEVCVGDIFIKSKIPTYFFHITNTAPRGFLVHI